MNSVTNQRLHFAELLAPAGNIEGFYGAVSAGANAVYLAGNRFGARAYADNFSTEQLVECIRYAHLLGRKVYLTVNTLLKEAEMSELYEYLLPFYEAGLDAVIVQDLGVLRYVRKHFPEMELHVSTQMTICDGHGAKLLKEMGASRIVPARELSLKEISAMKEMADVEIETFIHGAMCYCYSGQCLFSSILGGRSGNRGRCAQPCRLPYTVNAGKGKRTDCYPLSLKDMCTIEHIPALIEAGIDSFKIEGRMKKPEYTAGVTDVYRRNMDRYYELRERYGIEDAMASYQVSKNDSRILRTLYIRSDIQDGYYYKHNGSEMVTLDNPAYSGSDEILLAKIQDQFLQERKKIPVEIESRFETGKKAQVTMEYFVKSDTPITVTVEGDVVQPAQKQPISEENILKQLNKLGDTSMRANSIEVFVSENAFYSLKQMNELRRDAVELLEQEILKNRGFHQRIQNNLECLTEINRKMQVKQWDSEISNEAVSSTMTEKGYVVSIRTLEQLNAFVTWMDLQQKVDSFLAAKVCRLYVDSDLISESWDAFESAISKVISSCEIWIMFPYIIRHSDKNYMKQLYERIRGHKFINGVLVRSMDGFGYVKQYGDVACRADAGVYVWNREALAEVSELAQGFCLPYELKAFEQKCLLGKYPCEKIVYSRIPMMITANCVLRTVDKCNANSSEAVVLTDRYHKEFNVLRNCKHCYNIIYNSVPFSLYQECSKWRETVDLRIDFTFETKEEVREVLDAFVKGMPLSIKEYTTGHEKRGVE